jgi:glycerol-3-phosphate acyltransferase PlsX
MNIGIESKKGTLKHREAFGLLTKLPNFVGNVEGRDVFSGQVDVLVTDGFTGNVLLKTAEGVSTLIFETLASTLSPEFKNELAKIHSTFNYAEYPGAILMGVKGLIIKCHGNSSARALLSGIRGAITLLQKNIF